MNCTRLFWLLDGLQCVHMMMLPVHTTQEVIGASWNAPGQEPPCHKPPQRSRSPLHRLALLP